MFPIESVVPGLPVLTPSGTTSPFPLRHGSEGCQVGVGSGEPAAGSRQTGAGDGQVGRGPGEVGTGP